jgi:hypothetical protein
MATTVTSSIGSGGDYSTIQAWEDACPANLVTNDEIWRGECKKETFGSATISGMTTDSTRYVELTTEAGASFMDDADVRTNPLRADAANGALLSLTLGAGLSILAAYTRVSKLQFKKTGWDNVMYSNSAATAWSMEHCILESTTALGYFETSGGNHTFKNIIFIMDTDGNAPACQFRNAGNYYLYNCTFVRPSNRTVYSNGIFADWANIYCYNCAVFGFSGFANGWTTGTHNATDVTISWGSDHQTSLTYADQFENASSASSTHDFRTKAGADLIDTGKDTSGDGVTTDISGEARGATYDIGVWEVASGGGGGPTFLPRVIFL